MVRRSFVVPLGCDGGNGHSVLHAARAAFTGSPSDISTYKIYFVGDLQRRCDFYIKKWVVSHLDTDRQYGRKSLFRKFIGSQ